MPSDRDTDCLSGCLGWLIIGALFGWLGEMSCAYSLGQVFGEDAVAKWDAVPYIARYIISMFICKLQVISAIICWLLSFGLDAPYYVGTMLLCLRAKPQQSSSIQS